LTKPAVAFYDLAILKVKAQAKLTFRNARYGWFVLDLSLNLSLFTKGHA
jgi:hypothetical protein